MSIEHPFSIVELTEADIAKGVASLSSEAPVGERDLELSEEWWPETGASRRHTGSRRVADAPTDAAYTRVPRTDPKPNPVPARRRRRGRSGEAT